ncbi:hypothetical protein V2K62_02630 [Pseudomonas alliivorans]|uniref:hypothetical protein n=1 Tax=Pseudomonas TaxID=286 RepID=UPI001179C1A4|nr:hypothetical protein [Pseudomonas viridiflava]MEE4341610.1 hypothetical protein [Pseudomonas alliivorans]MEE4620061.1 hypothetical protein [Pseudomonas alliivorans]MEE4625237.1 hypothetical protein [Pseudomonas alliivorans]MEE4633314.1 hypothetical protein [Pseudomonas alliivorans]MEE4652703.1 hypothetical protein [Pseudomonas alliivorans]
MNTSLHGSEFSQSVEILTRTESSAQLVEALMARVDRFTSRHEGFIGSRVQVGEQEGEVHLHLFWLTREHGEHAQRYPVDGETDLFQFVCGFQVRKVAFRTSEPCSDAPPAL